MSKTILILEPDPKSRAELVACAETAGFSAHAVAGRDELAERAGETAPFAVAVIGAGHDDAQGGQGVAECLRQLDAPAIVVLAREADKRVSLLRAGAIEALPADATREAISAALRRSDAVASLDSDLTRIKGHGEATIRLEDLAGAADATARAVMLAERAARLHLHVMLEGERGVGKRLMARAIHAASGRAGAPFEIIDCAALSGPQADRELFDRRNGVYWRARGGSLFLREIGELPASAQVRLATLLETPDRPARELLQDNNPEVRLLASTSCDMIPLIKRGAFRDDLFYRLNVCPIWMPPLRERRGDIPALAQGFMRAFALKMRRGPAMLAEATAAMLSRYDWPGNLEELEREVFRAVLLAEGPALEPGHFPRITALAGLGGADAAQVSAGSGALWQAPQGTAARGRAAPALVEGMPAAVMSAQAGAAGYVGIPALTERGDVRSLEDVEADMIRLALGRYRGSMTEAARRLGIGRSTLYRKMREFGLDARSSR